jgi:hypothetical protein
MSLLSETQLLTCFRKYTSDDSRGGPVQFQWVTRQCTARGWTLLPVLTGEAERLALPPTGASNSAITLEPGEGK